MQSQGIKKWRKGRPKSTKEEGVAAAADEAKRQVIRRRYTGKDDVGRHMGDQLRHRGTTHT